VLTGCRVEADGDRTIGGCKVTMLVEAVDVDEPWYARLPSPQVIYLGCLLWIPAPFAVQRGLAWASAASLFGGSRPSPRVYDGEP